MKLKFKKLVAFVFAIIGLTIAGCFGGSNSSSSSSAKKGVVPTYTGMTISRNYVGNTTSKVIFDEDGNEVIPYNGNDDDPNVNYDSHGNPHVNNGNKNHDKEEIKNDVEELEDIDVIVDDTFRYYVTKGEIFTIEVHIDNPNDYEIQSFTLNGQKYANYMFKVGSTMELLLLDVEAPMTSGHLEYTIDAIKYIDGTEIKDVKIGGEKTVKAGVKYDNEPTARILNTQIKDTSVTIDFELNDQEDLIKDNEIIFYLADGEEIVERKTITLESTSVTFTDLKMGKLYQYGIFTSYDLVDGENVKERCLVKDTFTTLKSYSFKNLNVGKESVDFELDTYASNGELKYIAIFDVVNNYELVESLEDLSIRRFENLLSNRTYLMKVLFEYSFRGEVIEEADVVEFKTLEKVTPTLSVTNLNVYSDYVEFEPLVSDIDNVGNLTAIELYKDGVMLESKTDLTDYCFYGLLSSNTYELVLKYTYNLNDGGNDRVLEVRQEFTTLGKIRPTVSIENVEAGQDNVTFEINVSDIDNIGEISKVELYLDNELVQTLEDYNNLEFTNLLSNSRYKIKVTYTYDLNDGTGLHELVVYKNFSTQSKATPSVSIENIEAGQDNVTFEINVTDIDNVGEISKVELYLDNELVQTLEDYNNLEFTNLLSNSYYEIRVTYEYDLNDGKGLREKVVYNYFSTQSKETPSVLIENIETGVDNVTFEINEVDNDNVGKILKIELYLDNELVQTLEDFTTLEFTNLLVNSNYEIRVTYEYDLNDGTGIHKVIASAFCSISEYTIYFETYGGELEEYSQKVIYGLEYTLPTPTKTGYTFSGWEYNGEDFEEGIYNYWYDITVYAKWTANTYNVNYYDGETLINSEEVTYNSSYTLMSSYTKEELTLVKWIIDDIEYNPATNIGYSYDHDLDVYAKFYELNNDYTYESYWDDSSYNNAKITGYNGTDTELVIPEYVGSGNTFYKVNRIGEQAFYENYEITSVTMLDNIISIGFEAFSKCISLVEVNLPETLLMIDYEAFAYCSSLIMIDLPDSLETLNYGAFMFCYNLTHITIPDNITVISEYLFTQCENLIEVKLPNNITEIKFTAFTSCFNLTTINIPDSVTKIGDNAFNGCISLENIILPTGLKTLGYAVFISCTSLKTIIIPDGIKMIEESMFDSCTNLENIVLPSGLTTIKRWSFSNCTSLKTIIIPETVKFMEEYAFNGCYNLSIFLNTTEVPSTWSSEWNISGCPVYLKGTWEYLDGEPISSYYTVSLDAIGGTLEDYSITAKYNEEVTLSSPTRDGYTFQYWTLNGDKVDNTFIYTYTENIILEAVYTANEYTITFDTDGGTLEEYTKLIHSGENVILPTPTKKGYTFIGWSYNDSIITSGEMYFDEAKDITLVASWSVNTFMVTYDANPGWVSGNNNQYVVYGEYLDIQSWGYRDGYTFQYWSYNGERFDSQYYNYDHDITLVAVWTANEYTITFETNGGELDNYTLVVTYDSEFTLPTPTKVGYTFAEWEYNGESFEDGVYKYAFDINVQAKWTANKYTINYYDGETLINSEEVTYNSSYTLMSSYTKEELTLVKWIIDGEEYNPACYFYNYNYAYDLDVYAKFYELNNDYTYNTYWNGMEDITVITGYTGIDTELVIPEYVGSGNTFYKVLGIGGSAFYENYEITSVTMLDNIKYINNYAFYKCVSLVEVNLPDTLLEIHYDAFNSCSSLVTIDLPDSLEYIEGEIFANCTSLTSIVIPSKITSISSCMFQQCVNLIEVVLYGNITSIGYGAFSGCKSLISIELPNGLTTIGDYAFADCTSLTSIVIPEEVKVIEAFTFDNCSSLESITLPNGLTTIRGWSFNNCISLTSIVIPDTVKFIDGNTFYDCYNLSIFLNTTEVPSTWSSEWNVSNCKVYLKGTWEYLNGKPISSYYTVELAAFGGVLEDYSLTAKYNEEVTLPTPTRDGYTFSHWTLNGDKVENTFVYTYTENIILEAVYISNEYTITFDANGGTLEEYTKSVYSGETVTLPTPTKKGYTFTGWSYNDSIITSGEMYFDEAKDITLVATWIVNTYMVTYDANPGWVSGNNNQYVVYGEYLDIQSWGYRDGYTFQYWSYNGERFDSQYYNYDYDITLVAVWTANEYTITFETYGGQLDDYTLVVTYDQPYELPIPTRTGYTFTGWTYYGEEVDTSKYTYTGDIYLQANWTANKYTINYYDGETLINSEEVTYDSSYTLMSSFEKDKLTLVKWIIEGIEYNPATEFGRYEYAYDLDVYAKFYELNNDYTYSDSEITGYTGSDTELVIPEYVGSENTYYKVTGIWYSAFAENYIITKVTILENIAVIHSSAFENCISLVEVILPDTLIEICSGVFAGCSSLVNIELPESLTYIGSSVFDRCSSLTSIVIPNNIEVLSSNMFFECVNLESVTLPSSLKTIEYNAFYRCIKLESIYIPNSVTKIEGSAFSGCSALKDLHLSTSLVIIDGSAFGGCSSLESVIIPDSVQKIGSHAFQNCKNLKSIILSSNLLSIDEYAFDGCTKLEKIVIPSSVLAINQGAFNYCHNLSIFIEKETIPSTWNVNWNNSNRPVYLKGTWEYLDGKPISSYYTVYFYAENIMLEEDSRVVKYGEEVELPIIDHPGYTFNGWMLDGELLDDSFVYNYTQNIILEASLTPNTFKVNYYDGNTLLFSEDASYGLSYQFKESYLNEDGLTLVKVIFENVEYNPGDSIYFGYTNEINVYLVFSKIDNNYTYSVNYGYATITGYNGEDTDLVIPEYVGSGNKFYIVNSIGNYAFSENSSITTVTLPNTINSIGPYAFYRCTSLVNIELSDSLTQIYWNVFEGCISLVNIEIPDSVVSIGGSAFIDCTSLVSAKLPNGLTTITDNLFNGCIKLQSIEIPNAVTSIEGGAFEGCASLVSIDLPDSVLTIGGSAFNSCTNLERVKFSNSLTTIDIYAFYNCQKLESISLPSSLKTIKYNAFYYCTNLKVIVIPESVKIIEEHVFLDCYNLTIYLNTEAIPSSWDPNWNPSNCFVCVDGTWSYVNDIPEGNKFTATLDIQGGELEDETVVLTYGEYNELPTPTKKGYIFNGWLLNGEYFDGFLRETNDITLVASWSVNTYRVTYITESGSIEWYDKEYYTYVTYGDYFETTTNAYRDGYTFSHWTLDDERFDSQEYLFDHDITLVAVWTPNNYTITFETYGGELEEYTMVVTYGAPYELPTPTRTGYTFNGWTYYGEDIDPNRYSYTGDIWLQANWIANKYTVNYYDGETLINSEEVTYDSTYTFMSSYMKDELTLVKLVIDGVEYNPRTELYNFNYAKDIDVFLKFYELNNDYTYESDWEGLYARITGYTGEDTELVIPEYVGSGNTYYKVNAIGTSAFEKNHEITSVTLPNSITKIEGLAFGNCISLVEVHLPNSLTEISYNAFSDCISLTYIDLPDSIALIGSSVFSGCISLVSITLPDNIKVISDYLFYQCKGLREVKYANDITEIGSNAFDYCAKLENISLPETLTSIGHAAFGGCKSLTSIELPSSLKQIGAWAFNNCDGLTSIVIPEKVKIIEDYTFYECDNLESVALPSKLTTIKYDAFSNCPKLKAIVIPESVKIVEENVFYSCYNISIYLNVEEVPTSWDENWSKESYCNLFKKGTWSYENNEPMANKYTITLDANGGNIESETMIVSYNDILELPTPTRLGYVFAGWLLNEEVFDNYRYDVNGDITLVALWEESTYTITYYSNGGNLDISSQSVTYGKEFTHPTPTRTGYTFTGWYLNGARFYDGIYNLANDITLYADWTANNYTITYNANGGELEDYTQVVTYSYYTELYIPTRLGYTFTGWYLNGILYTNEYYEFDYDITLVASWVANDYTISFATDGGTLKSYTLGVTFDKRFMLPLPSKDGYTFAGWEYKNEIITDGIYRWWYDITLTATWVANEYTINYYDGETLIYSEEVTYDSSYTLMSSYTKEELTLVKWIIEDEEYNPATELSKYTYAYELNVYAKFYELNNDYTYESDWEGKYATITGYTGTDTELVIPEYVGSGDTFYRVDGIRYEAFMNNTSITSVVIPEGVTYIGYDSFNSCYSLTTVVLPTSLVTIEYGTFTNCQSLINISLPDSLEYIGEYAFSNCVSLTSVEIPNSVSTIEQYAFEMCSLLTNVQLSTSLTELSKGVFRECVALTNVIIPESVTTIGFTAFLSCRSLQSIVIPEGVKVLKEYAFLGCNELRIVYLPSTLEEIHTRTFGYCYKFETIVIPESVTFIDAEAFVDCSYLEIFLNNNEVPSTWNENWNYSNCSVYFAGEWEYDDGIPMPLI